MQRRTKGLVVMLGGLLLPGLALAQQESEALRGVTPASGYVGLNSSCALFEGEWWNAGDERVLPIRGACGVPEQAVAVLLEVRSENLGGESPQVKVWPGDGLEPAQGVLEAELGAAGRERQATVVVNLCASLPCEDLRMRSSATAYLDARVAGYFQPLSMSLSGGDAEESTAMGSGTLLGSSGELLLEPQSFESADNNFFGVGAGASMAGGTQNNFFGALAGNLTTIGSSNNFFGYSAGRSNVNGDFNNFFGDSAGRDNTLGARNSFFGDFAGVQNTIGNSNNFFGASAGRSNVDGGFNNFFGDEAGRDNTSGARNSFFGDRAGEMNTTGNFNSFFGKEAGQRNTTGEYNSFFGDLSGTSNTTGSTNVFIGRSAGSSNTVENNNTFVGGLATGFAGITNATALGSRARVTQSNSLVLGSVAGENGATESVNVGIGVSAPERQLHIRGPNAVVRLDRPSDATTFMMVRTSPDGNDIWKTFSVGTRASGPNQGEFVIQDFGQETGGLSQRRMTITNDGNVIFTGSVTESSSSRYKQDIETLSDASESLQKLRGVRFVRRENGRPSLGLVAEEVAKVYPELVEFQEGAAEAVNYSALVAVLVEGFKEQQATLLRQETEIAVLRAMVSQMGSQLAGLKDLERRVDQITVNDPQLSQNEPLALAD